MSHAAAPGNLGCAVTLRIAGDVPFGLRNRPNLVGSVGAIGMASVAHQSGKPKGWVIVSVPREFQCLVAMRVDATTPEPDTHFQEHFGHGTRC